MHKGKEKRCQTNVCTLGTITCTDTHSQTKLHAHIHVLAYTCTARTQKMKWFLYNICIFISDAQDKCFYNIRFILSFRDGSFDSSLPSRHRVCVLRFLSSTISLTLSYR